VRGVIVAGRPLTAEAGGFIVVQRARARCGRLFGLFVGGAPSVGLRRDGSLVATEDRRPGGHGPVVG